jgi:hypothetical protein
MELYVDWDLCAVPFSYPGEKTFSEEQLNLILSTSFKETDPPTIAKKIKDKMKQLQVFINKYKSKITILTMNCQSNVLAMLKHYNITGIEQNIVSILDLRALRVNVATNLFSAVLEYKKDNKTVEYLANKFAVTTEDIRTGSKNPNINAEYTKASWAKEQGNPFIFFDDSPTNIGQMGQMIKETKMDARCEQIRRPKRNQKWSVDEMGMFSEAAEHIWKTEDFPVFPVNVAPETSGEQKCRDVPIFKTYSF